MPTSKVLLLSCGAFNPPTIMHLRMFEIARDHLQNIDYQTVGGVISPVHDGYGKKDLAQSSHRCAMIQQALRTSNWIKLSTWECQQESWSRTRMVLNYHQNQLNAHLNDDHSSPNKKQCRDNLQWIPNDSNYENSGPIQVKLLCGADLLESFGTPGLWTDEDIDAIVGQHGLIVITREGANPYRFIYESDILTKYQSNITIVTEWITNDVSSTKIRRALRRHQSVKYLIADAVIDYIMKEGLYGTKDNDVNMESPSPTSNTNEIDYGDARMQYSYSDSYASKPKNGPVTYIRVERVEDQLDSLSDRLNNEENAKRCAIGYPGQAVQIIATAAGESKVHKQGLSRPACLL